MIVIGKKDKWALCCIGSKNFLRYFVEKLHLTIHIKTFILQSMYQKININYTRIFSFCTDQAQDWVYEIFYSLALI